MNDRSRLPSVSVVSTPLGETERRLRLAKIASKESRDGAVAFTCHWGRPEILVDCPENLESLADEPSTGRGELAAAAIELLRSAGLTQSTDTHGAAVMDQQADLTGARRPRLVRISMPAHFGVDLMLLVGAALRSLHRRHVAFVALCGTIDAALRTRFASSSLYDLKRYANQLPNYRLTEVFPLFGLIGVSAGIVEGVLDQVVTDQKTGTRHALTGLRPPAEQNRIHYSDTQPLSPIRAISIQ
jgi:hypothetical protein